MSDDAKRFWDAKYETREMVSPLDFTHKAYSYLESIPEADILDIGCGDGRDALFFASKGFNVTAIDFSEQAVERVRAKNTSVRAIAMDIERMDFEPERFDAVYAHLSLHYFDDPTTARIISDIHSYLRPGGFFFIKCKSTDDPLYGKGTNVGEHMFVHNYRRHFFTVEYMRKVLADFTIVDLQATGSEYDGKRSAFIEAVARK